jgi:hypothetical protein
MSFTWLTLGIAHMFADFHTEGMSPWHYDALKMDANGGARMCAKSWISQFGKASGPIAFLAFNFKRRFSTSSVDIMYFAGVTCSVIVDCCSG